MSQHGPDEAACQPHVPGRHYCFASKLVDLGRLSPCNSNQARLMQNPCNMVVCRQRASRQAQKDEPQGSRGHHTKPAGELQDVRAGASNARLDEEEEVAISLAAGCLIHMLVLILYDMRMCHHLARALQAPHGGMRAAAAGIAAGIAAEAGQILPAATETAAAAEGPAEVIAADLVAVPEADSAAVVEAAVAALEADLVAAPEADPAAAVGAAAAAIGGLADQVQARAAAAGVRAGVQAQALRGLAEGVGLEGADRQVQAGEGAQRPGAQGLPIGEGGDRENRQCQHCVSVCI